MHWEVYNNVKIQLCKNEILVATVRLIVEWYLSYILTKIYILRRDSHSLPVGSCWFYCCKLNRVSDLLILCCSWIRHCLNNVQLFYHQFPKCVFNVYFCVSGTWTHSNFIISCQNVYLMCTLSQEHTYWGVSEMDRDFLVKTEVKLLGRTYAWN